MKQYYFERLLSHKEHENRDTFADARGIGSSTEFTVKRSENYALKSDTWKAFTVEKILGGPKKSSSRKQW